MTRATGCLPPSLPPASLSALVHLALAQPEPRGRLDKVTPACPARTPCSLHAVVLLPGGQDALHQAAALQQLWGWGSVHWV